MVGAENWAGIDGALRGHPGTSPTALGSRPPEEVGKGVEVGWGSKVTETDAFSAKTSLGKLAARTFNTKKEMHFSAGSQEQGDIK